MALPLTDEQVLDVRERIRKVAEGQIAREGIAAISLRSIASEMGWTAASLYRYFTSKQELLSAMRIAAHNRFADRIEAAHDSTQDLWDRSRAIGDAYLDFAETEPAAYQLMFAYDQEDNEDPPELKQARQRSSRTLTTYVAEMVDAGLLQGDPVTLAHAFWASIHGLVVLRMAGQLDHSPPFDLLRRETMRLITRGARP